MFGKNNKIIGIAGGSGSGKSYLAKTLFKQIGNEYCDILYQDNYYIDQSSNFDFDGGSVNFDHPDSLDFKLLAKDLIDIKNNRQVSIPLYDFKTHTRSEIKKPFELKPIVIVDGILIFHHEYLREIFDLMIFVDTTEEMRFNRRLTRDIEERGRTKEGVVNQFLNQVKPMHDMFVQPTLNYADFVVKESDNFESKIQEIIKILKFTN